MSQVARYYSFDEVSHMQENGQFYPGSFHLISPNVTIQEQRMIIDRVPAELQQNTLDLQKCLENMKQQKQHIPEGILKLSLGFEAFAAMHKRVRLEPQASPSVAFAKAAKRETPIPKIDMTLSAAFCEQLKRIVEARDELRQKIVQTKQAVEEGPCATSTRKKSLVEDEVSSKMTRNRKGKAPDDPKGKQRKGKNTVDIENEEPYQPVAKTSKANVLRSAKLNVEFQKLPGGLVSMFHKVLYPYHFRIWTDQNGNEHFCHFPMCVLSRGTWIWRVGFSNGTYGRFHDIHRTFDDPETSPAKVITSLHNYSDEIYAVAWLTRPDVTPPPLFRETQPGEVLTFPKPKNPYKLKDIVRVITESSFTMYYITWSFTSLKTGLRVYHLLAVESDIIVTPSPLLVTANEAELGPPLLDWVLPVATSMWWKKADGDIGIPEDKLYYPALRSGHFEPGHIVAVPAEDGKRECARIIKTMIDSTSGVCSYQVQFPIKVEQSRPLAVFPSDKVLGPHIRWNAKGFLWTKIVPAAPSTARKPVPPPSILPPTLALPEKSGAPPSAMNKSVSLKRSSETEDLSSLQLNVKKPCISFLAGQSVSQKAEDLSILPFDVTKPLLSPLVLATNPVVQEDDSFFQTAEALPVLPGFNVHFVETLCNGLQNYEGPGEILESFGEETTVETMQEIPSTFEVEKTTEMEEDSFPGHEFIKMDEEENV